jgi:N-acetylmuramoyl-L-alanine amidase
MISMLLVSLLVFPLMAFAAEQPIHLFLNGKQLSAEVAPRIVQGNTIVPVRIIAESLGSKVQWEEKSRKVTVAKDDINIQLFINKQEVTVNNKRLKLETAPAILEGSTMLPLRFISEQFGVKVTWDEMTRSVFLFQPEQDIKVAVASPAAPNDEQGSEQEDGDATKAPVKPDKPDGKDQDKADKPSDKSVDKSSDKSTGSDKPEFQSPPSATDPAGKPFDKNTPAGQSNQASSVQSGQQGQTTEDNSFEALTTVRSVTMEGDRLSVKTSGPKAAPNVSYTAEPNRIVIDIPHGRLDPALKLGTNGEGIIKVNNQFAPQIRYLLFSKDSSIVRIIIDLSKKVTLKPVTAGSASELAWALIPPKERYRVVVDPGHGGKDTGAVSLTKRYEKDFVLALGNKIHKLLEKEPKIEAFITRNDDTFVELADRAAFANDREADLFVSVHGNSTGKETVRGVETYYFTEQSLPFANLMHKQMLKATGFPDRKVKQSGFYVIKNTTMPSLLLEVGFLSNETDENTMFQDAFQNQVAASIVAAIKQQLNID